MAITLLKIALGAVAVAGGFIGLVYFAQRSLMYFPERTRTPPADAGLPQAEEIVLPSADGENIIVWHIPPRDGYPIILYFPGNGGSLRYRADRFAAMTADGIGLVALSYRGYGGSTGRPTETGLIADARTAFAFATARYPANRLVAWGESLGGGVAIALAEAHPMAGLILEAPFHSAVDVGAEVYWFLPVRALMKDQFRSDLRIGNVRVPVLILHGERDVVVPIQQGEQLFARAHEPKRMVRFPDGGHEDLDVYGAQQVVRRFLAEAVH